MKRLSLILATLALAVLPGVCVAASGRLAPPERRGWVFGVNLGYGTAELRVEPGLNAKLLHGLGTGTAVGLRAGYAVDARLTLGLVGTGWSHTGQESDMFDDPVEVRSRCSIVAVTAARQSRGGGFLLRGGKGWGRETRQWAGSATSRRTGPAALLGLGYAWRLGRHFTLGPALDGGMIFVDGNVVDFAGLTAGLTWYP